MIRYNVTLSLDPALPQDQRVIQIDADEVGYDAAANLVFLVKNKIKVPGQPDTTAIKTIKQWVMFDEQKLDA